MKVSWTYSEQFIPTTTRNIDFEAIVKYTTKYQTETQKINDLWALVKNEKAKQRLINLNNGGSYFKPNFETINNFIAEEVGQFPFDIEKNDLIPEESLKIASEMYVYWKVKANINGNLWYEV